jgi:hypothetical protein
MSVHNPTCNDPIVISHARSLLRSGLEGTAAYMYADVLQPESIIEGASGVLDFGKPVALLLIAVLHFVPDEWDPRAIIGTLLSALPSGSFLVASQITEEHDPATIRTAADVYRKATGMPAQARNADAFGELVFTGQGLKIVEPGIVLVSKWRNHARHRLSAAQVSCYGGVARKP